VVGIQNPSVELLCETSANNIRVTFELRSCEGISGSVGDQRRGSGIYKVGKVGPQLYFVKVQVPADLSGSKAPVLHVILTSPFRPGTRQSDLAFN
jgi:hypothetical protein